MHTYTYTPWPWIPCIDWLLSLSLSLCVCVYFGMIFFLPFVKPPRSEQDRSWPGARWDFICRDPKTSVPPRCGTEPGLALASWGVPHRPILFLFVFFPWVGLPEVIYTSIYIYKPTRTWLDRWIILVELSAMKYCSSNKTKTLTQ